MLLAAQGAEVAEQHHVAGEGLGHGPLLPVADSDAGGLHASVALAMSDRSPESR